MKKKTRFLIFGFAVLSFLIINPSEIEAVKEKIYLIEVNFDRGQVSLDKISTKLGYAPEPEKLRQMSPDKYWIELKSFSGAVLKKRLFSISLEIFSEPPRPGEESQKIGPIILEQTKHLVILPYHHNGELVNLYDFDNNLLDQKDISYLADVCGDNVCQDHEDNITCPQDCEESAAGQSIFSNVMMTLVIGGIIVIVVIVIIYYFLFRQKRTK